MKRLPNVHPSDTVKWPNGNGTFDIGAYDEGSKILMYNETPLNIDVDFLNGSTDVLHAWEARWWRLDGAATYLDWSIDADSLSVTTPPISAVFLTLYGANENVVGMYPMPLVRTVGGNVTTQQSQTLDNIGNAPNSNVVTIASTGASGNTVTLTNDGLLQLAVTIAGLLKTVLQTFEPAAGGTILKEGASTYLTEQLGNLQVDGTSTLIGDTTFEGKLNVLGVYVNNLIDTIGAGTNNTRYYNPMATGLGGTGVMYFNCGGDTFAVYSNGAGILSGHFRYLAGNLSRITFGHSSSISGVSISHGLGATPDAVFINDDAAQPGSATVGSGSLGSTTFTATVGANNGMWWQAVKAT